jgi:hypothetical protein
MSVIYLKGSGKSPAIPNGILGMSLNHGAGTFPRQGYSERQGSGWIGEESAVLLAAALLLKEGDDFVLSGIFV